MKLHAPFREPAKVLMHLNSGYTRVSLTRYGGLGLMNGGVDLDIPTRAIPPFLRALGSQFLVIKPRFTPEEGDATDELRRLAKQVEVAELTGAVEPSPAPPRRTGSSDSSGFRSF